MSAATQVFYADFDTAFFELSPALRARIQSRINEIGLRLGSYPHHRLNGSDRFRARVGDYASFTSLMSAKMQFIC